MVAVLVAVSVAVPTWYCPLCARRGAGREGDCPVTLSLTLSDGAEATFSLTDRVEVGDVFLSGLERIFGAQVAELR